MFVQHQKQLFGTHIKDGFNLTETFLFLLTNGLCSTLGNAYAFVFKNKLNSLARRTYRSRTKKEAIQETEQMINVYATFAEKFMAMPVIQGLKSANERFAGALEHTVLKHLCKMVKPYKLEPLIF